MPGAHFPPGHHVCISFVYLRSRHIAYRLHQCWNSNKPANHISTLAKSTMPNAYQTAKTCSYTYVAFIHAHLLLANDGEGIESPSFFYLLRSLFYSPIPVELIPDEWVTNTTNTLNSKMVYNESAQWKWSGKVRGKGCGGYRRKSWMYTQYRAQIRQIQLNLGRGREVRHISSSPKSWAPRYTAVWK